MRLAVFGLVAGLMFAAPAAAQTADVLAPARVGQLQCFEPNATAKTCQALGGYTFASSGVIENAAEVLITPSAPVIVMRVTTPVTIRNNAICGPITPADIARATFTVDGAPASEAQTASIRSSIQESPMMNVDTCISVTPVDGGLRAETSIGGTPRPEMNQRVVWVNANDGWRVAP
jgi:hypothetical protein